MAAVICKGVGSVCSGVCDCVSAISMAPFKICGACCEGMGQCCGESCKLVTNCCSTSFCCYITVATLLNLPPIVLGLTDLPNVMGGCQGSIWLLVFWILCAVNIVAAFYMSVAIQMDTSILPTSNSGSDGKGAGRVKQLFCYDGWMAAYILVVMGFFGWLFLGAAWFATGTMDDDESCDDINQRVMIAYAFGWAFVFCGGCSLCGSLCCGAFTKPPVSRPVQQLQQQPQQQTSNTLVPAPVASVAPAKAGSTPSKMDPAVAPPVIVVESEPVQASAPVEIPTAKATLY